MIAAHSEEKPIYIRARQRIVIEPHSVYMYNLLIQVCDDLCRLGTGLRPFFFFRHQTTLRGMPETPSRPASVCEALENHSILHSPCNVADLA